MTVIILLFCTSLQEPAPTEDTESTPENTQFQSQADVVVAPLESSASSTHPPSSTILPSTESNASDNNDYFDVELESRNPDNNTDPSNEHSRLIFTIKSLADDTGRQHTRSHHPNEAPVISNGSSSSTISSPTSNTSATENGVDDNLSISSSDVTFFDPELASDTELKSSSLSVNEFYDCEYDDRTAHVVPCPSVDPDQTLFANGHHHDRGAASAILTDSDSGSESLPISQSTSLSSTFTANSISSSASNQTLQESALLELCLLSKQQYEDEQIREQENDIQERNSDEDTTQSTETDDLLIDEDSPLLINNVDSGNGVNDEDEVDNMKFEADDDGDEAIAVDSNAQTDEDEFKPHRIRRCSSLKSGKTPPGTPGRKKFVRFADVLGLDLADVKTFMDDIPTVPREAYQDLVVSSDTIDGMDSMQTDAMSSFAYVEKVLVPMFEQPGGQVEFLDRVREQNVCLENAVVADPICLTISGTVRVRNLDFNKSVHIRYSLDSWVSFADFQASYIDKSCDGFSDKFGFTIFGNSLNIGQRIEMAVRFSCKGEQFWDSNYGVNYCFQCMPSSYVVNQLPTTASSVADESALSPRNSVDEIAAGFLPEFPMSNGQPPYSTLSLETPGGVSGSFY